MRGPLPSDPFFASRLQHFRNIIGPNTSYGEYLKALNGPAFKSLLKPEPKYNKEMLKFIGGMALQQGAGTMAEWMQTSENKNIAAAGGAL